MNITKKERSTKLTFDTAGEFSLPDYLPAIGKLLSTECFIVSDEPYIKENGSSGLFAELGGEVIFRVTWLGEESGEPATAVFHSDYDTSAPIGISSSPLCDVTTTVENAFCRVTGPRKLSLRARLAGKLTVLSDSPLKMPDSLFSGKIERLDEKIRAVNTVMGSASDLYAAAVFHDDAEIMSAHGNVAISSCHAVSPTEVKIEGEISVSGIAKKDGELLKCETSVPFEETVSLSGETVEGVKSFLTAKGTVDSVTLNHDEMNGTTAEISYSLSAVAMSEVEAFVIRDAFSCAGASTVEYEELRYLSSPTAFLGNVTVNEKCENTRAVGKVLYCDGAAIIDSVSEENSKLRILGTLSGNVISAENGEIVNIPYSVPWKYETAKDSGSCADISDFLGCAVPISVSAHADGTLNINAEISLSCIALCECAVSTVKSIDVAESSLSADGYSVAVYFPEKGENVWDIAKHFRVPTSRVAAKGNLNDDGTPKNVVVI